ARCLDCGQPYSRDEVQGWLDSGVEIRRCPACGGVVKPHTILFGEPMPAPATQEAERRARASDVFVVVGSSLVVYPAAYMPADANRIQDELRDALVNRGERLVGWKAGFTSKGPQRTFGVDHPVCGFLLASGVFATGDAVPVARFAQLAVEVEVAFVMRRELAGP